MNLIFQIAVLLAFLALGEVIVRLTHIPIPASILGMILLAAALKLRVVKLCHVERVSDFLTRNMGFFFVPAGVGLMNCLGLLKSQWLPIVVATVVSTAVIIAVTGHTHSITVKLLKRVKHKS